MKLNFNLLKIIAIAFGIFTFCWMIYDFIYYNKSINKNYIKANEAFLEKDFEQSLLYYELALEQDPENIFFLEGKARALFRLGDFSSAENLFKIVIKLDEDFIAALANLGILYDTLGDHKNAVKYYKLAVNKNSKVTEGMSWLKRFLKNIHFRPSSVNERLNYLERELNSTKQPKLNKIEIDKMQPDFQM